jgi:hypothetical protein
MTPHAGARGQPWFRRPRARLWLALGAVAGLTAAVLVVTQVLTRPTAPISATAAPDVTLEGAPTADASPAVAGLGAGPSRTAGPRRSASAGPADRGAASGFPGPRNTGVPAGTSLSAYRGPCTITTSNAVIDRKIVDCDLAIKAKGVVIRRSKINGRIDSVEESPYSFTLEDSEVDAGVRQLAAVGTTNMTVVRSDIRGGVTSAYCWANCTIRDSWLHGQRLPDGADWHLGGFLANDDGTAGRTNATLVHNTIVCDATPNGADGGCSGDVNLFGDFGRISHVTVDNNLLGANTGISYCLYGGSSGGKPHSGEAEHIVVVNNVFQRGSNGKCGAHGPVTAFDASRPGNRWGANVWDNGGAVRPGEP